MSEFFLFIVRLFLFFPLLLITFGLATGAMSGGPFNMKVSAIIALALLFLVMFAGKKKK